MKTKPFQEFYLTLENVKLRFRKYPGKTSKNPILLIHGLSGNLQFMHRIATALAPLGRDVYSYDLRGRGKSDKPEGIYGPEIHAEDLKQSIEALKLGAVSIVAHSLGCWICLALAEKNANLISKSVLLDGGAVQPILRKWRNLQMVRLSLTRIGRFFSQKADYFQEIQDSPFISAWNDSIEQMFAYELEKTEKGYTCSLPSYVMEAELNALGGSLTNRTLVKNIFVSPSEFLNKLKKNKNLPYSKLTCPTLLVRALRENLSPSDEMIPDPSYQRMLSEIPNVRGLTLHECNHYQFIIEDCPVLDREMIYFLR